MGSTASSTALATEMTSVIRDFGTGVENHGRALGSSVRDLVLAVGGAETSRARIARDIEVPTVQVLGWIAAALRASSALLDVEAPEPFGPRRVGGFVIVDRQLTRC